MKPRGWLRDGVLVTAAVITTWVSVAVWRANSSTPVAASDTRVMDEASLESGLARSGDDLQDESARLRSELDAALTELRVLRRQLGQDNLSASTLDTSSGSGSALAGDLAHTDEALDDAQGDDAIPELPAQPALSTDEVSGIAGAVDLVNRGVSVHNVATFQESAFNLESQRAEVIERARAEGWANTPRYQQALAALDTQGLQLRQQVGEANYDRYLYAAGLPNRLAVSELSEQSPAADAGLREGDVLVSYNGKPIYGWNDLRVNMGDGQATPDAGVVRVLRDGKIVEFNLPPHAFGYQLEPGRYEPET